MGFRFAILASALCLCGCGTIIQGTTQEISIATTPPGARCELSRPDGIVVATVEATPETVSVRKTKHDLLVSCALAGYRTTSAHLESGYGIAVFGNIAFGYFLGWGVDSATGADNKYPSAISVTMVPAATQVPAPRK